MPDQTESAIACFASHGSHGILDLGASKTVIGSQHLGDLINSLDASIRQKLSRCPCQIVLKFGNQSTLASKEALVVPIGTLKLKIAVVPGGTPFLISNTLMRTLRATIDCATQCCPVPWCHIPSLSSHTVLCKQQVGFVATGAPSKRLHEVRKETLPNLRSLALDPVHVAMHYEAASATHKTPGSATFEAGPCKVQQPCWWPRWWLGCFFHWSCRGPFHFAWNDLATPNQRWPHDKRNCAKVVKFHGDDFNVGQARWLHWVLGRLQRRVSLRSHQ